MADPGCPAGKAMGVGTAGMDDQRLISVLLRAEKAPQNMVLGVLDHGLHPDFKQAPLSRMGSCIVWNRQALSQLGLPQIRLCSAFGR